MSAVQISLIVVYLLEWLMLWRLFFVHHPGNDAAGRGMAMGFGVVFGFYLLLCGVALVWALSGPSTASLTTAAIGIALPILLGTRSILGQWFRNRR
ncbi:MAG: hypothetical protein KDC35_19915 [Acidobacteria bacterium]|nr:hypothetical protein [Acidobacteriota bacterium]